MLSFRDMRTRFRIDGFQCHHLVPTQVIEKPAFAKFFADLRRLGFDPQNFEANGMHLPCTEQTALIFDKPLHRGPHPLYNQMVSEHVSMLARMSPVDGYIHMGMLQRRLRKSLNRQDMIRLQDAPLLLRELRILEDEAAALYVPLEDILKH